MKWRVKSIAVQPRARLGVVIAIGAASACSSSPPPPEVAQWQTVLDRELDRAVLSAWGTRAAGVLDLFVVGGAVGNGGETLALHFDGNVWRDLHPGGTETFWWVNGTSPNDVWMVGTDGRIAHWDGRAFTSHPSGTTATIWGVWAFAPNDAWAVGGTPGEGTASPNDLVLHWDGGTWKRELLPDAPLGRALFKVWGTSANNLYVVGEAGTIWHRKGGGWTLESKAALARGTLFTVYGCDASEVWAVGGNDVLRSDGAMWTRQSVDLSGQVNGVACTAPASVAIVGTGGLKQRLVAGRWIDEFSVPPFVDLHAVWGDPQGGDFWAVGGDWLGGISSGKPRRGVVARWGKGSVSMTIVR